MTLPARVGDSQRVFSSHDAPTSLGVVQLGERVIRDHEVAGSNPATQTTSPLHTPRSGDTPGFQPQAARLDTEAVCHVVKSTRTNIHLLNGRACPAVDGVRTARSVRPYAAGADCGLPAKGIRPCVPTEPVT